MFVSFGTLAESRSRLLLAVVSLVSLTCCTFDLPDVLPVDTTTLDGAADVFDSSLPDSPEEACVPDCKGKCKGDPDGCLGTCQVDDCPSGEICSVEGICCRPQSCEQQGIFCGVTDDHCGHDISCGICKGDDFCANGKCEPIGLSFRTIQASSFTMGSPATEPGRDKSGMADGLDETLHTVTLTHDFSMSRTEITREAFLAMMGYDPSLFQGCSSDCPVNNVSWDEAAAFANELSKSKQLSPCFVCTGTLQAVSCQLDPKLTSPYECPGYRLPTEAEWEFAARGGKTTAFHTGDIEQTGCEPMDANLSSIAWYRGDSRVASGYDGAKMVACGSQNFAVGTHPVDGKTANKYGLVDMAGNVFEWTLECPNSYPSLAVTDPFNLQMCNNIDRVIRGGSVLSEAYQCRHAERLSGVAGHQVRALDTGFRVVRTMGTAD